MHSWGAALIVRLIALAVFLLAAIMVFGDILIAHANTSPDSFLNGVAQKIKDTAKDITAWFGFF